MHVIYRLYTVYYCLSRSLAGPDNFDLGGVDYYFIRSISFEEQALSAVQKY